MKRPAQSLAPETHTANGLRRCPAVCTSARLHGQQCAKSVKRGGTFCVEHSRTEPVKGRGLRALRDEPGHVVTCDPAFHGGLTE